MVVYNTIVFSRLILLCYLLFQYNEYDFANIKKKGIHGTFQLRNY